ncbi:MAG: DUF3320 domain-containing protein [Planctomycetota bacterium]
MRQQKLIEDLLDEARIAHPGIEDHFGEAAVPEPVFVKNLENVQGDERDVILFSICYGFDIGRRIAMNFGPMNSSGGERRLNVAITRARREVIVFSSIRAEHIDLARTQAEGMRHLKTFLDYAHRGPRALAEATQVDPAADFDSPFERDVAEALRGRGHLVDLQVGCSGYRIDLAVKDPDAPGRYLLGIECDGAAYHSAASARDRDRLRQSVLEGLGWTIHRVWSSDWWANPGREIEGLEAAIARARREASAPAPEAEPPSESAPPSEGGDAAEVAAPGAVPDASPSDAGEEPPSGDATAEPGPRYAADASAVEAVVDAASPESHYPFAAEELARGDEEAFLRPDRTRDVAAHLAEVVAEEGPVAIDRAFRRVAAAWGFRKLTARPRGRLETALAATSVVVRGDFLWPHDLDPARWDRFRPPHPDDPSPRKAEEIPPEELAMAALDVLRDAISLPREELARKTARRFGISRLGARVESAMEAGIAGLLARGAAVADGDIVRLEEGA